MRNHIRVYDRHTNEAKTIDPDQWYNSVLTIGSWAPGVSGMLILIVPRYLVHVDDRDHVSAGRFVVSAAEPQCQYLDINTGQVLNHVSLDVVGRWVPDQDTDMYVEPRIAVVICRK